MPVLPPSQLFELLNVAWARHEISSDSALTMLKWFEAGGKRSVADIEADLRRAADEAKSSSKGADAEDDGE